MKKFLSFFLFALCLTVAANAQTQTLTVGDPATYYNGAFPINGFWLDSEGTLSQFIIPAESLADMDGGTISKMIFTLSLLIILKMMTRILQIRILLIGCTNQVRFSALRCLK